MQARDGAAFVLAASDTAFPALEKIWADQADTGALASILQARYGITLEIVTKLPNQEGFVVLPHRWVVERTFAWLGRYRRLSKDDEHRVEYRETWVYIASIARMVRKLHPNENEERPYQRKKSNDHTNRNMLIYK